MRKSESEGGLSLPTTTRENNERGHKNDRVTKEVTPHTQKETHHFSCLPLVSGQVEVGNLAGGVHSSICPPGTVKLIHFPQLPGYVLLNGRERNRRKESG